jgi:hypothetical protein
MDQMRGMEDPFISAADMFLLVSQKKLSVEA